MKWNKLDESEAALKNGWFYTGDLARIDDEGFLNIVDRKEDMIITGGENVYPVDVPLGGRGELVITCTMKVMLNKEPI